MFERRGGISAEGGQAQWHIFVNALSYVASVGDWVLAPDNSRWFSVELSSDGVQNRSASWDIGLTAGEWRLDLYHEAFSDVGIYSVQIDGVTVGTIDGYNAAAVPLRGQVAFTVANGGTKRLTLLMATKNVAASEYRARVNGATLVRTA